MLYKELDEAEELSWMNYEGLLDMEMEFVANLGETELTIRDILQLEKGSVIDLKKSVGESVASYVNGSILAKGEVIIYDENFAIRINEILSSNTVLYHLSKGKS